MPKAYLTIDDSPSEKTPDLLYFLGQHGIQSLIFVRGHRMDENSEFFDHIVDAIPKGHIIGNHSYAHKAASEISFEGWCADFERCEVLIERAYEAADVQRPAKYYRFPYLDRGDGVRLEREFPEMLGKLAAGVAFSLATNEKSTQIQAYLAEHGFTQPFSGLDHPLYTNDTGFADTHDVLLTCSAQDWRMTPRHQSMDIEQLKQQMRDDPYIERDQVMLVHDEAVIHGATKKLIHEMLALGFKFQPVASLAALSAAGGMSVENIAQAPIPD